MKPSEAPAEFILAMIGNLYDRPQMYCNNLKEFDALLYFAHYLWAEIADRREQYLEAGGWHFNNVPGFYAVRRSIGNATGEPLCSRDDFSKVAKFWQRVDKKLEIKPMADKFAIQMVPQP